MSSLNLVLKACLPVAVAWGIVAAATAGPLDHWQVRNPYLQGSYIRAMTHGSGRFAAVGDFGVIVTSEDGRAWTNQTSGSASTLTGVAYGGGVFVAVGGSDILVSSNAVDWSRGASSAAIRGVTYGNGTFVAVGSGGAILLSQDGRTWTIQNSGTTRSLLAATHASGRFIAVGDRGTILTSPDGVLWTARTTTTTTPLLSVAYGNGYFVAAGSDSDETDVILRSADGEQWTSVGPPPFPSYDPQAVAFGNGLFAVAGNRFLTSTDGASWTNRTSTNGVPSIYPIGAIAFGDGLFVAASSVRAFITSSNGIDWVTVPMAVTTTTLRDVIYANNTFVAVGWRADIVTSTNAVNWVKRSTGTAEALSGVAYGASGFVAVGASGAVATSTDGVTWVARNSPSSHLRRIAYGNGLYVAVGDGGLIRTSPDGATWTTRSAGITVSSFLYDVAYGNGTFAIVGSAYTTGDIVVVLTSRDGMMWTDRSFSSPNGGALTQIAHGNGRFVALGGMGALTSVDGVTWIRQTSPAFGEPMGFGFGNGNFIAVSGWSWYQGISTSTDGVTWINHGLPWSRLFILNSLTYGQDTFVAVGGEFGTIIQSGSFAPGLVSMNDVTVSEGNAGITNAIFTVSLTTNVVEMVSVDYATADGTATAGEDYLPVSGTLVFNPGESLKTIAVPVMGDIADEADESFFLRLSNPTNATLIQSQAIGTILDNDTVPLSVAPVTVIEGNTGTTNAVFALRLARPHNLEVSVHFATTDDTAVAGADYVATNGTVIFAPGETEKSVMVGVSGDTEVELHETFYLSLSQPVHAQLIIARAAGTIIDDEPAKRYVNLMNSTPLAPYTTWATAATNIQHAIDIARMGDEIVVTNGVYATGGLVAGGSSTNRVAVIKPVTVRSVNGPRVTWIVGHQPPGTTNGSRAVRCVYLTNGATLVGFTLTNGVTTGNGGGVLCQSTNAAVSNCVMTGNSADQGGGAYGGSLNNCLLTANSAASNGGGAWNSRLSNCVLHGNSAGSRGGGAALCVLNNCTVTGNAADSAAGTFLGTVNNCIVYYNVARRGLANYGGGTINYSCTTPLPVDGVGNISVEPQLASASHLSVDSPCRGAGSEAYATGADIDGEVWGSPPSIGCDEYRGGSIAGPLTVAITASFTNVAVGFNVRFTASIAGHTGASRWDFGDGTVAGNQPYANHAWQAPGDYTVVLWAYNESHPDGVSATGIVRVVEQPVHYVAVSGNPVVPYSSWATAATNIQDAVDAAMVSGAMVLVSNGVYQTGGRVADGAVTTNRVAVIKPVALRSVNGPEVTVIAGFQVPGTTNGPGAVRCVYLADQASLAGFTMTRGATPSYFGSREESAGGGVWCASDGSMVSNCVLTGNSAYSGGGAFGGTLNDCTFRGNSASSGLGGGVYGGTLRNCTLIGNSARFGIGGGAYLSRLRDCAITANFAERGGGAVGGELDNCVLTGNAATTEGGGVSGGTLNQCALQGNSVFYGSGGGACQSKLNGCTLIDNSAHFSGGGATYCTLNNCILTGNWATNVSGGGAFGGALNNCALSGNSAMDGGGAAHGMLNNCTLAGNQAVNEGGGAFACTINNSIVYYNRAQVQGDNYSNGSFVGVKMDHSCTTPLPPEGMNNTTAAPLFLDQGGGNLRLQSNSPCIDRGSNGFVMTTVDLDGRPRIVSGRVDIGAYEYQDAASGVFIGWLQQHGLSTDGSSDNADPDGDRLNNFQEWRAGTDPTNALSVLRLLTPLPLGSNLAVIWQSIPGRNYALDRGADLGAALRFLPLATNLPASIGTNATTYTHTNATKSGASFYRVRVE